MKLGIADEIVLLGLDEDTGKSVCYHMAYALSGAILADLVARRRIAIDSEHVHVTDRTPTGDDVLDEALQSIASSEKTKIHFWVRKVLADHQRERILNRLVEAQVLDCVEKHALGIFPYQRYPAHDRGPEDEIRARLRFAAITGSAAEERTRLLLSIAEASGLEKTFLPKEEAPRARAAVQSLIASEPIGSAVRQAISDDAAAATAVVMGSASIG